MKFIFSFYSIVSFSVVLFSQTHCDIKQEYQNIFKIEKIKSSDYEYLYKTINNKIDSNSCFYELVNENDLYLDYLLTNFSDYRKHQTLIAIDNPNELQKEYIVALKNDSVFNEVMETLTKKITDKSNYIPDTISMDELMNSAVKFFFLNKRNEAGYYVGKVCVGINGLNETEKQRKPQIEAFCFATILTHYESEKFNLLNEFIKGIKEIHKLSLGENLEDGIKRAQGAMYMFMKNNEVLKQALLFEYEVKKRFLPFILDFN